LNVWDERKLGKSLRIAVKELGLLKEDAQHLGTELADVEGDGDRAAARLDVVQGVRQARRASVRPSPAATAAPSRTW
jgi:hypothetical protein